MSNLMMWNLIVGFLSPTIISIIQQPKWRNEVRVGVTFILCMVFGGFTAYLNGQWNFGDVVGSILTVSVAAITFYKGLWKPAGVTPAIENATSPGGTRAEVMHPEDTK